MMKSLICLLILFLYTSCAKFGSNRTDSEALKETNARHHSKVLSPSDWETPVPLKQTTLIQANLLNLCRVVRAHSELRYGPGVLYKIHNLLVPYNSNAIVLEQKGKWVKVAIPKLMQSGWIHTKALKRFKYDNADYISIETSLLPVLRTKHQVKKIYVSDKQVELKVDIPKNIPFVLLNSQTERNLLWIPQSNSIAWVDKKDLL